MSPVDFRFSSNLRRANVSTRSLAIIIGHREDDPIQSDINRFSSGSSPSMKLLVNENGERRYQSQTLTEFNTLYFDHDALSPSQVNQIIYFFPGITSLTFVNRGKSSEYFNLLIMLKDINWKRQLTELKIFDTFEFEDSSKVSESVFKAINLLPSLKLLAMELNECLELQELPIFGRLNKVSFNCWDEKSWTSFLGSLLFYGSGNSNLKVDFPNGQLMILKKLYFLGEQLRGRVVRLSSHYLYDGHYDLQSLYRMFPSLTSLSVDCRPSFYWQLVTGLSNLQDLVHLKIRIDLSGINKPMRQQNGAIEILNSVKALDLSVTVSNHTQLTWLKIFEVMPNLEAINLDSMECLDCKMNFSAIHEDYFHLQKKDSCIIASLGLMKRNNVQFNPQVFRV